MLVHLDDLGRGVERDVGRQRRAGERSHALNVADQDQVVVGVLGRVEQAPSDDLVRRVIASHGVDREANLPSVLDAADGREIHRRAPLWGRLGRDAGPAVRRRLLRPSS